MIRKLWNSERNLRVTESDFRKSLSVNNITTTVEDSDF